MTDHRINLTLYKLDRMMMGEIDEVVDALLADYQAEPAGATGRATRMTDTLDSLFAEAKARFLDGPYRRGGIRRARPDLRPARPAGDRPS